MRRLQDRCQVPHTHLAGEQQMKDAKPSGVGEGLEHGIDTGLAGVIRRLLAFTSTSRALPLRRGLCHDTMCPEVQEQSIRIRVVVLMNPNASLELHQASCHYIRKSEYTSRNPDGRS